MPHRQQRRSWQAIMILFNWLPSSSISVSQLLSLKTVFDPGYPGLMSKSGRNINWICFMTKRHRFHLHLNKGGEWPHQKTNKWSSSLPILSLSTCVQKSWSVYQPVNSSIYMKAFHTNWENATRHVIQIFSAAAERVPMFHWSKT